ncbi:conserved hypothetical protein [Xenorhabdus bovienii str. oregonense]|uniref:Uncharacterized protein n=1 Tax=Xenorhabdus bovienii str. oregonense TaxID=1398202 RepID=A0A077P9B6_XENBV|nr:DUF1889 family protein [Xenorhabdus bovienii]MDE1474921.1 DUF1889 family protein [Xenorhabdus bovienii]CDH07238.1 conserved hypothetical protein [Xenorhabdus bovienii str. oregonense]
MQKIHEVVLQHFNKLNTSSSTPHSSDECNIKDTLKFLKKENSELSSQSLNDWAVSNKWDAQFTKKVNEWLLKINSGGRVVIKHKGYGLSDSLKKKLLALK